MNKKLRLISLFIFLIAGIAFVIWLRNENHKNKLKQEFKQQLSEYTGSVKPCAVNPEFPKDHGLVPPYMIDLRQKGYRGLRILEYRENGKILQLPSWSEFGWLGLHTVDKTGNIYVSSIPHESIVHNPVGEQNRILKLDHLTGELFHFMDLPQKEPSTLNNPFGAMGLHFDCDNEYLYVSSVAGSSMREELGSLFQIELGTKKVISSLENTDAIGLATYNTEKGKRVYYGKARTAEVYSIGLDENGSFSGQPSFEFSLLEQNGGADDRAHRIRFNEDKMEIKASEFNFTLAAASNPMHNIYLFEYDHSKDTWSFLSVQAEK
jgi:hypothetical protein